MKSVNIRLHFEEDDVIYNRMVKPFIDNKSLSPFLIKIFEMYFYNPSFKQFFMKSCDTDYTEVLKEFNTILRKQRDIQANLKVGQQSIENSLRGVTDETEDTDIVAPLGAEMLDTLMPSDMTIFDLPTLSSTPTYNFNFDFDTENEDVSIKKSDITSAVPITSTNTNTNITSSEHITGKRLPESIDNVSKSEINALLKAFSAEFFDIDSKEYDVFSSKYLSGTVLNTANINEGVKTSSEVNNNAVTNMESSNSNNIGSLNADITSDIPNTSVSSDSDINTTDTDIDLSDIDLQSLTLSVVENEEIEVSNDDISAMFNSM